MGSRHARAKPLACGAHRFAFAPRLREAARGYSSDMLIGLVIVLCVVLAVLAFLLPRLSRGPQRGVSRAFGAGGNAAGKAPGRLGRLLRKPFDKSAKATNKSARTGRQARDKLPL